LALDWLIDKAWTPSYLSPNRPIRPQLPSFSHPRRQKRQGRRRGRRFPHSAATDERVRWLPRQRSASVAAAFSIGFG